jgi:beta-phosphoglucomutase-like phosphatase (HAD superfamily)
MAVYLALMVDAVLCELEDVLVETAVLRRRALQRSLAEDGLTLTDAQFDEHCAGLPLDASARAALDTIRAPHDETTVDLLALRAEREFTSLAAQGIALTPGAREFVERSQGVVSLALVTRARRREVQLLLSLANLDSAFECIVAAEDALQPKPSPRGHFMALQRLSRRRPLIAERVVALEDSPAGIQAARAAALRCVAVSPYAWRFAAEADACIASIAGQSPATLDALASRREETVG